MNDKNSMNGQNRDDKQEIRNSSTNNGNTNDLDSRNHRQDNDGMHGGNVGGSAYQRPQASGDAGRSGSQSGYPQDDRSGIGSRTEASGSQQHGGHYGSQEHKGCGCHDRGEADKWDSDKKKEQQNSDSIYADPTQRR